MAAADMAVCDVGDLDRLIYTFDVLGYVVVRQAIDAPTVARMNAAIDAVAAASPRSGTAAFYQQPVIDGGQGDRFGFGSLATQQPEESRLFTELMADERGLAALRVMVGDWCRCDHAYGIQMSSDWSGRENLHGGARTDQGEHQYQWYQGRMFNGLVGAMYALTDVQAGAGGFVVVPGSHRANHSRYTVPVDSPLVVNPQLAAGDMLFFTEALLHGTTHWRSAQPRRSLLYKYSPGYSCWMEPAQNAPLLALAATPLQQQLLRPPSVAAQGAEERDGPLRAALGVLPTPGQWGSSDPEVARRREAARL
jgi:ectoine hydroxylase-related dioxygenase (phytanoyl-CoA dioxygenase family)